MRIKRLLVFVVIVGLFMTMGFTGCTKNTGNSSSITSSQVVTPTEEVLPEVELKWVTLGVKDYPDTDLVEEAMNEILLEKINATINIETIPYANYWDKLNLKLSAGEEFDILFTGAGYFVNEASKGEIVDITTMLDNYGTDLQKVVLPGVFDAARINGKIYGVPNLQGLCMPSEMCVRGDLFEKYSFPTMISSFDELDDAFDKILKNEKITPLFIFNPGSGESIYTYYIVNTAPFFLINGSTPGAYTKDMKVINQYESDHFKDWITWANKAYKNGWINSDAATAKGDQNTGPDKFACSLMTGGPQNQASAANSYKNTTKGKYTPSFVSIGTDKYIKTSVIRGTMNAVSSTSKNPERAVMLLNLINTDKELYNLMCYGIEGTHYVLKDGFVDFPAGVTADTSTYYPNECWAFGNVYNALLQAGQDGAVMQKQLAFDATATPEPAMGFSYDGTAMKTEIAQCTTVLSEYLHPLACGALDPEVYLPIMLEKLKEAGSEKIIADMQSQLDTFVANRK